MRRFLYDDILEKDRNVVRSKKSSFSEDKSASTPATDSRGQAWRKTSDDSRHGQRSAGHAAPRVDVRLWHRDDEGTHRNPGGWCLKKGLNQRVKVQEQMSKSAKKREKKKYWSMTVRSGSERRQTRAGFGAWAPRRLAEVETRREGTAAARRLDVVYSAIEAQEKGAQQRNRSKCALRCVGYTPKELMLTWPFTGSKVRESAHVPWNFEDTVESGYDGVQEEQGGEGGVTEREEGRARRREECDKAQRETAHRGSSEGGGERKNVTATIDPRRALEAREILSVATSAMPRVDMPVRGRNSSLEGEAAEITD
ncbi:hypothetical protein C8R47DRAFT_1235031 [Mycena vitilis]|nr:hypothetical protein C8R47DRAFT_1235031 [Mycena vitilis]